MCNNKVYVGDTGTKIKLDAGEDISTQTTLKIKYKKPSGSTGEWVASVEDTNYAVYTTISNDLDEAGIWKFQIYIVLPTWEGHGETLSERIYDLFE